MNPNALNSALVLSQLILQWTTELRSMAALLKAAHENGGTGLTDDDIKRLFDKDDAAKARAAAAIEFVRTGVQPPVAAPAVPAPVKPADPVEPPIRDGNDE